MTHQSDSLLVIFPLDQISQSGDGKKDQNHQRFAARGESSTRNQRRNLFRVFLMQ